MGRRGRVTRDEFTKRTQLAIKLLSAGYRKSEISAVLKKTFDLCPSSAYAYINRAKRELQSEIGGSLDYHKGRAYQVYLDVLRDANATRGEKIRAQREIDELLGLKAPKIVRADVGSTAEEFALKLRDSLEVAEESIPLAPLPESPIAQHNGNGTNGAEPA
jgi:hypothetical protein